MLSENNACHCILVIIESYAALTIICFCLYCNHGYTDLCHLYFRYWRKRRNMMIMTFEIITIIFNMISLHIISVIREMCVLHYVWVMTEKMTFSGVNCTRKGSKSWLILCVCDCVCACVYEYKNRRQVNCVYPPLDPRFQSKLSTGTLPSSSIPPIIIFHPWYRVIYWLFSPLHSYFQ